MDTGHMVPQERVSAHNIIIINIIVSPITFLERLWLLIGV